VVALNEAWALDWKDAKFVFGLLGLLLLWFGGPVIDVLMAAWGVCRGKDNTKTRTSKREGIL
jgi:hypothetical protein